MCSELSGDCAPGSTSVAFGGEADIMYCIWLPAADTDLSVEIRWLLRWRQRCLTTSPLARVRMRRGGEMQLCVRRASRWVAFLLFSTHAAFQQNPGRKSRGRVTGKGYSATDALFAPQRYLTTARLDEVPIGEVTRSKCVWFRLNGLGNWKKERMQAVCRQGSRLSSTEAWDGWQGDGAAGTLWISIKSRAPRTCGEVSV